MRSLNLHPLIKFQLGMDLFMTSMEQLERLSNAAERRVSVKTDLIFKHVVINFDIDKVCAKNIQTPISIEKHLNLLSCVTTKG